MNSLPKLFATTLLAASVLSGCGGGSSQPASNQSVQVAGTAVKGVIAKGIVKAFDIDGNLLKEGVTNDDGSYSLDLADYTGPVVVEITAGADSKMTCDVVDGCGSVAYGQLVDISADDKFSLKAVIPEVKEGEAVSANVTALTTLAAKVAEEKGLTKASAEDANTQIANLFDITGDITELAAVDVTKPSELARVTQSAQQASVVNAALLAAVLDDSSDGASVGSVLENLASQVASADGQLSYNLCGC